MIPIADASNSLGPIIRGHDAMRIFRLFCVTVLTLYSTATLSSKAVEDDLIANVHALEKECESKLGIGLVELGLLTQASTSSVFLESGLAKENRLDALNNLAAHGYVKVDKRDSSGDTYIQFVATKQGQLIIDALSSKK